MVLQGTIKSRPHKNLDHRSPLTKELPYEFQKQYCYVQEQTSKSTNQQETITASTDKLQNIKDDEQEDKPDAVLAEQVKKTKGEAKRSVMTFASQESDLARRLQAFAQNEYPGNYIRSCFPSDKVNSELIQN